MRTDPETAARAVVVTGANGLVGTQVCRELAERGATVRALVRRAGTAPGLPGVTEVVGEFHDPQVAASVVDGAGSLVTTVHPLGGDHADQQRRIGVDGTLVIARAARDAGLGVHVHVSTAAVYDRSPGVGDVDENSALVDDDANFYAVTKRDADAALAALDGITRVLVRPPAVLGPGETSIWNTISPQGVAASVEARTEVPERTWAWVHVTDLARLIADVAGGVIAPVDSARVGPVRGRCTPVNVAAPGGTWRDYLTAVCEAVGVEPVFVQGEAWTGQLVADRARSWGWRPQVALDQALAQLQAGLTG